MRASNKGELAFCLLFWLQTKNDGIVFEHARMARRVKARDGFHKKVRRQQANLETSVRG